MAEMSWQLCINMWRHGKHGAYTSAMLTLYYTETYERYYSSGALAACYLSVSAMRS